MSQRTVSSLQRQRRDYAQQRIAKADKLNAELDKGMSRLQTLLKDALYRDSYVDLASLKQVPRIAPFEQKKPALQQYLPTPPSGLNKMLPWKKNEYERACEQGEERFKQAERQYQKAKAAHEFKTSAQREIASEHNRKLEALQENFAAGIPTAVTGYFNRVLRASDYPRDFPQKWTLAYTPDSRQLAMQYDLPAYHVVPKVKAYRYVKAHDEIKETALPQSQRKQLYSSVLAQIPLRTIRDIFTADRSEKVDTVVFNGYVKTIDPSTGNPGEFCLVAVSATRHQFFALNLELVAPRECIKGLKGRLSRKPEDLVAIEPMELIRDDSTPVSTAKAVRAAQEPQRADEIYHRVATPGPEETARAVPIPVRTGVATGSGSISPKGAHFVELGKRYLDRTEARAEPVPFQQYWPTYPSMDTAQMQWYFYWRAQLRQGTRLPTDLSYLFVHIYEVINMIGFDTALEAFNYLDAFWRYYRRLQPKLDRYLPDWIADFIVLHELAPNALDWYSNVAKITEVKDLNFAIEACVISDETAGVLSNAVIFDLANYDPTKSKFHKLYAESSNLDTAYKRALNAVDEATRHEQGKSLFQLHLPEHKRVIRRTPFESAVHAYPRTEIEVAAAHYWTNVKALSELLNSIVKHVDNVLRQQAGYKYRVRGIQLTQRYKSIIEAALQPEAPKPEISIDHSEIEQLAKDSEAIRARLLAAEESEEDQPLAQHAPVDEQFADAASSVPETPSAAPTPLPAEAGAQTPEARAALYWSRIGARRNARAMLLRSRFAVAGVDRSTMHSRLADQRRATSPNMTQSPASQVDNASAIGPGSADAPAASGFLHRPHDTPADLLTDLAEVAHIMGEGDGKRAQLIAVMMENEWECPADSIALEFPGEFINVIIDEINSIALEEIGDILILEEDGHWIVQEEYRDETEYILQHPDYLDS